MIKLHTLQRLVLVVMMTTLSTWSAATSVQSIELTPFSGYRIGGSFEDKANDTEMDLRDAQSYGVIANFDLSPGKQVELLYSHQETSVGTSPAFSIYPNWNIDVDYFHIGGVTIYDNGSQLKPFVAGGIGLTYFNPEQLNSESKLSLSLAGGGKLFISDNVGLRFEARAYWTYFNNSSAIFCNNGSCLILAEGDTWMQFESNMGLFVRF